MIWYGGDEEGTKNWGNSMESSTVSCHAIQLQNTTLVLTLNAFDYASSLSYFAGSNIILILTHSSLYNSPDHSNIKLNPHMIIGKSWPKILMFYNCVWKWLQWWCILRVFRQWSIYISHLIFILTAVISRTEILCKCYVQVPLCVYLKFNNLIRCCIK